MAFAAGQSSRDVLLVARDLREAVETSLLSSAWAVQEVLSGASTPETVETANRNHQRAVALAHQLRWMLRDEEPPPMDPRYEEAMWDMHGPSVTVQPESPEESLGQIPRARSDDDKDDG